MLDRTPCFALLVVTLLFGHSDAASGQTLPMPPQNKNLGIYPPSPPPDFALKVHYDKQHTPKAKAMAYQQVQDILNRARIGIPEDRLRYFRSVISPDSIRVQGWEGIIDSMTPVEAGVVVSLRVHAHQPGMADSVHLIERYSIINGEVNYLGAVVPPPRPRFQVGF